MSQKVLIAFATMSGSTRDVAETIGEELQKAGIANEVRKVTEIKDISQYSAVVVGTTVMMGMLNRQGAKFLKKFQKELATKKVAYFLMCGALGEPSEKNLLAAQTYMQKMKQILPEITPISSECFAGGLKSDGPDLAEANFFFKWIIPKIHKEVKDYRDFEKVRQWAKELASKLGV